LKLNSVSWSFFDAVILADLSDQIELLSSGAVGDLLPLAKKRHKALLADIIVSAELIRLEVLLVLFFNSKSGGVMAQEIGGCVLAIVACR
jgi:hypothetical protein